MIGFDGFEASTDAKRLIRDYGVGHVILFARNVDSPEQVAGLVRELQECARLAGHETPLLMAVDQEGGRVARMGPPWTVWPRLSTNFFTSCATERMCCSSNRFSATTMFNWSREGCSPSRTSVSGVM